MSLQVESDGTGKQSPRHRWRNGATATAPRIVSTGHDKVDDVIPRARTFVPGVLVCSQVTLVIKVEACLIAASQIATYHWTLLCVNLWTQTAICSIHSGGGAVSRRHTTCCDQIAFRLCSRMRALTAWSTRMLVSRNQVTRSSVPWSSPPLQDTCCYAMCRPPECNSESISRGKRCLLQAMTSVGRRQGLRRAPAPNLSSPAANDV